MPPQLLAYIHAPAGHHLLSTTPAPYMLQPPRQPSTAKPNRRPTGRHAGWPGRNRNPGRNDGPSIDEEDKHWSMITHGGDGIKHLRIEDDATSYSDIDDAIAMEMRDSTICEMSDSTICEISESTICELDECLHFESMSDTPSFMDDETPIMEKMYMVHEDDDITPCLLDDEHGGHMEPTTSTTPTSYERDYKGTRKTRSTSIEHELTKRALESIIQDLRSYQFGIRDLYDHVFEPAHRHHRRRLRDAAGLLRRRAPAAALHGRRGAPGRCRRRRPLLSQQELSTAIRDLATAVQGIRLYLIGTQGMTTPPLPPALNAYSAAPAFPPVQGVPAPPPASPPSPSWSSWQPAPSAGPASLPQGVPIQRVPFPPSPSRLPAWVTATEPPPVYSSASAPPPVYTTAGDPPRPSFPEPAYSRLLDFATYDGVEDPLNWLNQCEQFFRGQRTLASDRTWLASYHLRGAAQTWYYSLEQDEGGMPPWDRFRELCLLRFGPPIRGSRLAELGRLAFTTTVQDFADRFQALACHAPGVTGQQRAELFIGGLPDHIRVDVEMRDPQDLQSAMYYARAFEQRARAMQQAFPASDVRPADRPPPTPPGQALTAVTHAGHSDPAATRPFRRLTTAEQLEHRRKGLCFNCDELYVPGHVCPRLFYLETVDDIAADVVAAGLADAAVSQADTVPG
ncbi:hypothetical protein QYE76_041832 [Lolium multiflorum]|uniref:Retrotransposon gag domain-containing protein n=1 Tax=Lolium multiflorum TaxID=4521 RepID=A0AAD8TFS3_LOLMU|nr:hypothetical protein QYE76_041832 [Lolium multiflorum]